MVIKALADKALTVAALAPAEVLVVALVAPVVGVRQPVRGLGGGGGVGLGGQRFAVVGAVVRLQAEAGPARICRISAIFSSLVIRQ